MRWPRVALTRRRVALAACRFRGPHFLHMECHKQHLCTVFCHFLHHPSLPNPCFTKRLPKEFQLSIIQVLFTLCQFVRTQSTSVVLRASLSGSYIYIHISLSATSPGNTCLARASKMRTEYDSSKSIYFGLFCLPFKLSMSLFLFLFLCLEDRQHFPSQSVSISRSSIGYDQSYINHLKSSDPAPRAIAAIAPFFP